MAGSASWQAGLLVCWVAAASASTNDPQFASDSADYERDIAKYSAIDPSYPPAMRAQLDFVAYITKHLDVDCIPRLDQAKKLWSQIEANPAATVVLPDGAAYLWQLRYAIAAHRAACTKDKAAALKLREEARLAAAAAGSLYNGNHDYLNMAVMQFNQAYQARELGDADTALKELQLAIAMDRNYGLREDAEDNFRYLAEWQGRTLTDLEIAEFMNTLAARTVTPKFAWTPVAGHWTEVTDFARVRDGKVIRSNIRVSGTNAIAVRDADLIATMHADEVHVDSTDPAKASGDGDKRIVALAQIFGSLPPMRVSRQGEYKGVENADDFATHALAQLASLRGDAPAKGDPGQADNQSQMDAMLAASLSREGITKEVGQGFYLEVGLWANTTLTQNRWLQGETSMSMNGVPAAYVKHDLRYVFAGWVPCAAGAAERRCVELLVKADPDEGAVQNIHDALLKQGKGEMTYWSTTAVRVVVDPATLVCYSRDTRRYSYLALVAGGKREVQILSSLDVSAATYPP